MTDSKFERLCDVIAEPVACGFNGDLANSQEQRDEIARWARDGHIRPKLGWIVAALLREMKKDAAVQTRLEIIDLLKDAPDD